MHDGMIVEPSIVASRAVGMPPIGALGECPPLAEVAQIDRMLGRREHQRARIEHVRQHARIVLRIGRDLGESDVAGRPHEFAELPVRDRLSVHPEAVHGDAMGRRFFRIVPVRPMRKVPPGIQIILSISEGPSQRVASDVSLATGCPVIKALPPNRLIHTHLSGNTLGRKTRCGYWTVVQHSITALRGTIHRFYRWPTQACPQGRQSGKKLPIDFADESAYGPGGCRPPKRAKVVSSKGPLTGASSFRVVLLCFWNGGLFWNDRQAHSLVECRSPVVARGGISRR